MDIPFAVADLLFQYANDRTGKDAEYLNLSRLEGSILEEVSEKVDPELMDKLIHAQSDLNYLQLYRAFQAGLHFGIDLFLPQPLNL